MTTLIGQMLGCLLVAAGIGSAVGWLLRNLSAGPVTQQLMDTAATLRHKEQALEKLQYELKIKVSAMQVLESKMIAAEVLHQSTQTELTSRHDRILALQEELAATKQQLSALESGQAALRSRLGEHDAAMSAQADEIRQSNAALESARAALALKEQDLLQLQDRSDTLNHRLAEADRLRTRIQELEPAQGRVHWLEVQMSERDMQHRTALHDLEQQLADRDRQLGELAHIHRQIAEHIAACASWEAKCTQAVQQATDEAARSGELAKKLDDLQSQLSLREQRLGEKDDHIATLQRHIDAFESAQKEMAGQAKMVGEKEEEISRLRKRLVEVRAALRIRADGGGAPLPIQPSGNQLSLQISQSKPSTAPPKDDLKEIHGIGPAFERVLNSMGIVTFRQVALWDNAALQQVAEKLDTVPDRIRRDKWMAAAKKLHEQKYGKRL